jgi:hypothetical protein
MPSSSWTSWWYVAVYGCVRAPVVVVVAVAVAVRDDRRPSALAAGVGTWLFVRVTLFFLIGLEKRDSFLPGAELQGVEQHPVAARGAFGLDGNGDAI